MATRRGVLAQIALGLGVAACKGALAQPADRAAYVGIETSGATGLSRARFLSASGAPLGTAPLDFRAHGLAEDGGRVVVFPRRPGNRFAVVDGETLEIRRVVTAPPGRHFYGHGAFSRDGSTLLVTENDLATLQGGIGVYDATHGWRRLGQIALPGPGPHEIVRETNADRFHVALGGLETHPAYGRTPLNLGTFRSQIVTLGLYRSEVEPLGYWPGTEGISLRHLAADGKGCLWIGGQIVDNRRGTADSVLWRAGPDGALPAAGADLLDGYVSSVAAEGRTVIATSKAAGLALHLVDGAVETVTHRAGASAVGLGADLSVVGGYDTVTVGQATVSALPGHEFDNHGLVLALR